MNDHKVDIMDIWEANYSPELEELYRQEEDIANSFDSLEELEEYERSVKKEC